MWMNYCNFGNIKSETMQISCAGWLCCFAWTFVTLWLSWWCLVKGLNINLFGECQILLCAFLILALQIEKLWTNLLTCVQTRHCGSYNSDLLTVMSPLLVCLILIIMYMYLYCYLLVLRNKKTMFL